MKHELGGSDSSGERPHNSRKEQSPHVLVGIDEFPQRKKELVGPKQKELLTTKAEPIKETPRLSPEQQQRAVEFKEIVKQAIETESLADAPHRNVFDTWVKANAGDIETTYVSREQWEEKKQGDGVLVKENETTTLFMPEDFKLWDVKPVAQAFSEKAVEKIDALGETFTHAGVYLATQIENTNQKNPALQETGDELYRYGKALQTGTYDKTVTIDHATKETLTPEQIAQGEKFFGVKDTKADSEKHFADLTERIKETIQKPQEILDGAIFQRGKERLLTELGKDGWKVARDIPPEELNELGKRLQEGVTLSELLDMPTVKAELAAAKEQGVDALSEKELEVARKIEGALTLLIAQDRSFAPSTIIQDQKTNCVGQAILRSTLLEEAGVQHAAGNVHGHAFTLLVPSNNKVYWQDEARISEITDKDIKGQTADGKPITIADIAAYVHEPHEEGLKVDLISEEYKHILSAMIPGNQSNWLVISSPERGVQSAVADYIADNFGQSGNVREAYIVAEKTVRYEKKDPGRLARLVEAYYYSGNYEAALSPALKAVELAPEYPVLWKSLREFHIELGNYEAALEPAKKAVELVPTNPESINMLGDIYYNLERYEEAVDAFQQAIVKSESGDNEELASYYSDLGYALRNLDKPEEALIARLKTVELAPDNSNYWNNLGITHNMLENPTEAEKAFTQAIELDPQNSYPQANLGEVQYHLGKYQQAEENLTQAIAMDSSNGEAYFYLALTQEKLDKPDAARASLQQALEKADPEEEKELIEKIREKMSEL